MNEVISSILQAEEKAEHIVSLSAEKSKKIRSDGEAAAENIKNTAIAHAKLHKASDIAKAEEKADAEFDDIVKAGHAEAEKLFEKAKGKVDAISSEIVNEILK